MKTCFLYDSCELFSSIIGGVCLILRKGISKGAQSPHGECPMHPARALHTHDKIETHRTNHTGEHTMRIAHLLLFSVLLMLTFTTAPVSAQPNDDACPTLVEEALARVAEGCQGLGRNQICYGNDRLSVSGFDALPLPDFEKNGDTADVERIAALTTAAMNVEENVWGIALMALQANIPNTLPGQNVTFVVFGDVSIQADPDNGGFDAPMQAFSFTTGIGTPQCREAPFDGVLLQTPDNVTVKFKVNGLEIEAGSTVLLDERNEGKVWVSALEGSAKVTSQGETQRANAGYIVITQPGEAPQAPQPYKNEDVRAVPVSLLPRDITIPFVLDSAEGTRDWVVSDFVVTEGREYTLVVRDNVNIFDGCTPAGMEGTGLDCRDMVITGRGVVRGQPAPDDAPLPGGVLASVLARIGDDEPFYVGTRHTFTARRSGTLAFTMNDRRYPDDNVGAFVIFLRE